VVVRQRPRILFEREPAFLVSPVYRLKTSCCYSLPAEYDVRRLGAPSPSLKQVAVVIAPFLENLFCRSVLTRMFPDVCKAAFIALILKNSGLDSADVK
jgi:hypothetical protein